MSKASMAKCFGFVIAGILLSPSIAVAQSTPSNAARAECSPAERALDTLLSIFRKARCRDLPKPDPVPSPAPPMPPPPPPPPPPTCVNGPYVVFFEWNDATINADAASILDNAVSGIGNCGQARLMLAGHADRSGPEAYNVTLSERRNASVRAYLEARGVPSASINSHAFGESAPRVPTADGVREMQNRRVEILFASALGM